MEKAKEKKYSLEDFLLLEEEQQKRYEYHDGEVFAMAGGTPRHSAIATNLLLSLGNTRFDEHNSKKCRPFNSDLKIHVQKLNKILYPDVSVFCGERIRSKQISSAYVNPILIIEVVSESTAAYDRGDKFRYYMHLSSLQEYVLVEQDQQVVQTFFRVDNDRWTMRLFDQPDAIVALQSVLTEIPINSIYLDID